MPTAALLVLLLLVSCRPETEEQRAPAEGHRQGVMAVTFTPDGQRLVSGGFDGTLRLWDVSTARQLHVIQANVGGVTDVAVSPNGKWVASTGMDKTVRLFETSTWREARTLRHLRETWQVAFSADGRRVVSAGMDGVRMWDVETGRELRYFPRSPVGPSEFSTVAISRDGLSLALAGSEPVIRVRSAETGKEEATVRAAQKGWPMRPRLAFGPKGKLLAVADTGPKVLFFELRTRRALNSITLKQAVARYGNIELAFDPDERFLAITRDIKVEIHDLTSAGAHRVLAGHADFVTGLAFSPDGSKLATSSFDQTVKLWEVATGRMLRSFGTPAAPPEEPD